MRPCTHADLLNVFEVFLPQLLLYPNPTDPLNGEAAALMMREPERYAAKIREYVERFGQAAPLVEEEEEEEMSDDDDDDE